MLHIVAPVLEYLNEVKVLGSALGATGAGIGVPLGGLAGGDGCAESGSVGRNCGTGRGNCTDSALFLLTAGRNARAQPRGAVRAEHRHGARGQEAAAEGAGGGRWVTGSMGRRQRGAA